MPLNQTSILTSAQGRQLAQRRWQSAASVASASPSPAEAITDFANFASAMRAVAIAGIAGLAAFVICKLIRGQILQSSEGQSHQSSQTAAIANGQGWSVLIALAIAIGVFIWQL
jgi:hypothetical protein